METLQANPGSLTANGIRDMERASIRAYVKDHQHMLCGRVLDFGAGKPGTCRQPQPYRELLRKATEYVPVDLDDEIPDGIFDSILMTQVIQYLDDPLIALMDLHARLGGGALVMTGPTCWAEVGEDTDRWRFTLAGIRSLLTEAGFRIMDLKSRASVDVGGFVMSLGWGVTAVKE
jgi:SAM-dependent methyltransferase